MDMNTLKNNGWVLVEMCPYLGIFTECTDKGLIDLCTRTFVTECNRGGNVYTKKFKMGGKTYVLAQVLENIETSSIVFAKEIAA